MIELKNLRRENSKVYRTEEGKYRVESYPFQIHYFDKESLEFEEYNGFVKPDGNYYSTIGWQSKIYFNLDNEDSEMVHMIFADKELSWTYTKNDFEKKATDQCSRICKNRRPLVRFSEVFENIDVEYACEDRVIKESMFIKTAIEKKCFELLLTTKGLLLKYNKEHNIFALFDKGRNSSRPQLLMTIPKLIDARGIEYPISCRARRISSGVYKITIDLSLDWSEISNQSFPFSITHCLIDYRPRCETSDEEQLKKRSAYEVGSYAMNVTKTWVHSNENKESNLGEQEWKTVSSTTSIIFSCEREDIQTKDIKVGSGVNPPPMVFPYLLVEYLDRRDYNPKQERLTCRLGKDCRIGLELDSGELTIMQTDMVLEGSVFEAKIVRCYDSMYSNDKAASSVCSCGRGWRVSAQQKLEAVDGEEGLQYIYTDGFGKRHYFIKSIFNDTWESNGLFLIRRNSSMYKYFISDNTRSKLVFDENGFLVRVYDENENFVNYTYSDGKLCKVNDSYGRVILLFYRDGILSSLLDPQKRTTTYAYDEAGKLLSVTHPGGLKSSFAYDEQERLTKIFHSSGREIEFLYEATSCRVIELRQNFQQTGLLCGQVRETSTQIEYPEDRVRIVTDSQGKRTAYHFDGCGNCVQEGDEGQRPKEEAVVQHITIFGYDVTIVRQTCLENNGETVISDFDGQDKVRRTTIEDEKGNRFVTVYQYNEAGKLTATQDYRGIVTQYLYSAKGFLREQVRYHSGVFNEKESLEKPARRFIKEYYMDKNWEYIAVETDERGEGILLQYEWDPKSGLLNYVTEKNHVRKNFAYDHETKRLTSIYTWSEGEGRLLEYEYKNDYLTKIFHNGFSYQYEYDGNGKIIGLSIANVSVLKNSYSENTMTQLFATGEALIEHFDLCDGIATQDYLPASSAPVVHLRIAQYNAAGRLIKATDCLSGVVRFYDVHGLLQAEKRAGRLLKKICYNTKGRIAAKTLVVDGERLRYSFRYETRADGAIMPDGKLFGVSLQNGFDEFYCFDLFGRVVRKSTCVSNELKLESEIEYLDTNRLTGAVKSLKQSIGNREGKSYTYVYDTSGRITEINIIEKEKEERLATYKYDGFGQLVREDNYRLGCSLLYNYDRGGNMIWRQRNQLGQAEDGDRTTFSYDLCGWRDRLIAINGEPIRYDKIGNPVVYRGNVLFWKRARLLMSYGNNAYGYDSAGNRIVKNATTYELDGDRIIAETTCGQTIIYYYGVSGPVGFRYEGESYFYQKNLFGDVERIYKTNGELVGEYVYDAWGICSTVKDVNKLATVNPFRYRSYYFDRETGLYYFGKRYYDPFTGRFINPTDTIDPWSIYGCNLFLYGCNDPINVTLIYGTTLVTDHRSPWFYQQRLKEIQTTPFRSMIPYPEKE